MSDYRGLTVSEIDGRAVARLRDQGLTYHVVKNRLARIAADQAGSEELAGLLIGPSAVALGGGDESAVARAFLDATRPFRPGRACGAPSSRPASRLARGRRAGSRPAVHATCSWPSSREPSRRRSRSMAVLLAAPLRNLGAGLSQVADQREARRPAPEPQPARNPPAHPHGGDQLMATITQDQLLEAIDGMTVLELSEFIKKFEERYGVTAAAPVAAAAAGRPRPPQPAAAASRSRPSSRPS